MWFGELAGNAAGQTALTLAFTSSVPGADVIRCPASGPCHAPERVPEVRYESPQTYLGPFGTVKLFWQAGCKTEACFATSARYIDRPAY